MKWVLVACLVVTVAGCKKKDHAAATPAAAMDAGASAAVDAAAAEAIHPPRTFDNPEALWTTYQQFHRGATVANAVETGELIDRLLSQPARDLVMAAAADQTAGLPTSVSIQPPAARYRLLGHGAVVRTVLISQAILRDVQREGDTARLTIASGITTLHFTAVHENGMWRLGPSPDLVVSADAEPPPPLR